MLNQHNVDNQQFVDDYVVVTASEFRWQNHYVDDFLYYVGHLYNVTKTVSNNGQ